MNENQCIFLGTGLYKTSSFINHSCDPNVITIFDGPRVVLRAIKDIEEGEELLLSYINLLATTQVRQMELNEGYMFECTCSKCVGKGVTDFMMMSINCSKCSCLQSLCESGKI